MVVYGGLTPRFPTYSASIRSRSAALLDRLAPNANAPFSVLSADAPTITTGTSATLTARIVGPHTGEITEVGSRGTWNTASGRLPVAGVPGLDFYYTGQACEIHIFPGASVTLPCWVFVDGLPVSATPDTSSIGAVTSSTNYYVKLTWGSAKRRRIEFFTPHNGSWYDVRGSIGDVFSPGPRKPVVAWVGDSFYAGSTPSPVLQCSHFIASRLLGVECAVYANSQILTQGGTGYVASGSFSIFGDPNKVSAAERLDPDLVVFQGSVNDDASYASVQAAAQAAYEDYAEACPSTPFIVLSPQPTNATGTLTAFRQGNISAVKAAATGFASVIGFHDEVGTATRIPDAFNASGSYIEGDLVTYKGSVWEWNNGGTAGVASSPGTSSKWKLVTWGLWGTGQVGTTTGDGNRDTLVYSDGIHPDAVISNAWGAMAAEKIREDLRAYAIDGSKTVD